MKTRKAFTLIELLVVIAIIGILASIVLVSLRGATTMAKDARVTAAVEQVRSIAEVINARDASYSNLCSGTGLNTGDSDYGDQLTTINGDVTGLGSTVTCHASDNAYCVYATLLTKAGGTTTKYYCVDSTGKAGETTTDPSGVGYCDGTTFVCP